MIKMSVTKLPCVRRDLLASPRSPGPPPPFFFGPAFMTRLDMAKSSRDRRIGVPLICLGLLLVVVGLGIYTSWGVVGGDAPPPSVDPTIPQEVDLVGIAAHHLHWRVHRRHSHCRDGPH